MADHRQLHVVMFPWLAHGHITPYLDLAKGLLSHGLRISFLSTPLNIARIKKQIVPGIELVELPLPSVDGLPSGVESTAAELHQGFEDHTHGRGLVITEWAPQLHILNHPSTGAFLSHCGWNSVTEGLRFGQPFVALPIQYEQGITARLIAEDLKLGVEVRRNEEDGSFTKEDVAKAVRAVMVEEEGKRIKSNVEEISRVLTSNDCQVRRTNIRNFVSALKDKASSKQTV
ncbi:hypothetical protein SUGI_1128160 [Cryptomeria japonica]|nr:hypothetical protein SUGI_1128110 [Cryptomeria japonica]GLJ52963.1 hypothetical protein SUGI_1128160 [Cryptomeria japonica]